MWDDDVVAVLRVLQDDQVSCCCCQQFEGLKDRPFTFFSIVDRCVWDSVAAGFYTWLHFFLHAYFEKKETDDPDMI